MPVVSVLQTLLYSLSFTQQTSFPIAGAKHEKALFRGFAMAFDCDVEDRVCYTKDTTIGSLSVLEVTFLLSSC
jgi:hypothetical protein